ncbi:hypothetical protein LTR56_009340 [Elasticomyces elasticus]|nr:hypothetical protein LTR56_009340 [Elasticomyces elasticus]KAK3666346.1 hypothetical protein LTR22_002650 [Elasticomyces elasticus]KAK4917725.1 hypothetical protein LTR49_014402 [Elasticomyces elasticus]KAK5766286.1 hypothetical protein LTS12_003497 [Elasticomyces elasticus]
MRLINVDTFALQEFAGAGTPPYAILSHNWGEAEVSFGDIQDPDLAQDKLGFVKIFFACRQAKADGLDYVWVDTCCIDKNSSHELSEAINSMFSWYMSAEVCYVYLADVPGHCPSLDTFHVRPAYFHGLECFEASRWWTRSWTLQELLAPRKVLFFGCAGNPLGALEDLIVRVAGITGIESDVLTHKRPLRDISIARRLSWAANRDATRAEDVAYSLFGILDVNMPLLYGEGPKAFQRLQEELIRQSTDQSIFAWDAPSGFVEPRELLLAPSPRCFANGRNIRRRRGTAIESAFRVSNKGLEISLPIVRWRPDQDSPYFTLGILDCRYEGSSEVLALVMSQHPFNLHGGTPALELYVSGFQKRIGDTTRYTRLMPLEKADFENAKLTLLTVTRDLQSQAYVQTFTNNANSWFPVRFMGNEPTLIPVLRDLYPEQCWYEGSRTMRLPDTQKSYGAVAVSLKDGRVVLITFGLNPTYSDPSSGRVVGKLCFLDPDCPLEPHVESLWKDNTKYRSRSVSLPLNDNEQLVAQLWSGALTVSIETAFDDELSSSASARTLSPPTSPQTLPMRTFGTSPRRDSMLQDGQHRPVERPRNEFEQAVHRSKYCTHCREVRAREEAQRIRRERESQERAAAKEKERLGKERMKKVKTRATQAGVGLSIGGIIADMAEVAEYF